MPKFLVKSQIKCDRVYEPGEIITLTDEQAAAMPHAVAPLAEPAPRAEDKTGKRGGK